MSAAGLLTTTDEDLLRRFTESANTHDRVLVPTREFDDWFAERVATNSFQVTRFPSITCPAGGSSPTPATSGTTAAGSSRSRGCRCCTDHRPVPQWSQPIINQPEIGILGILVKEFDGVLHCLMQAKMEPGNLNLLQLSPTVQATRSNYTRVHQGEPRCRYLEYFAGAAAAAGCSSTCCSPSRARGSCASATATWSSRSTDDVPVHDDFCWLTLGADRASCCSVDNLINMDARTVLSCLPSPQRPPSSRTGLFARAAALADRRTARCTTSPRC